MKTQKPFDSLLNYRDFVLKLLPYIRCTSRGIGAGNRVTYRIELKELPSELSWQVRVFEMHCVACNKLINPFRPRGQNLRGKSTGIYFSATCSTDVSKRCCRTKSATEEFELVAQAIQALLRTHELTQ